MTCSMLYALRLVPPVPPVPSEVSGSKVAGSKVAGRVDAGSRSKSRRGRRMSLHPHVETYNFMDVLLHKLFTSCD